MDKKGMAPQACASEPLRYVNLSLCPLEYVPKWQVTYLCTAVPSFLLNFYCLFLCMWVHMLCVLVPTEARKKCQTLWSEGYR